MKTLTLKRILQNNKYGTFGVLIDVIPFALTLELPWKDNQDYISCIPKGEYLCFKTKSPKHGDVFQLKDVPDRDHILLHKGNSVNDTKGCILIGKEFNAVDGQPLLKSDQAFKEFMTKMKRVEQFWLKIEERF
jgi:hypothetical protein